MKQIVTESFFFGAVLSLLAYELGLLLKKKMKMAIVNPILIGILAVMVGICSGVLASLGGVFLLAKAFDFSHELYVTLLPKSITTAIGIGVSEELGGIATITVAVIIITGILGNVIAEAVFRFFHISEPIAKGLAIGTSSHALGTAKALELGQVEGAMSGLAIVVAGLLTVILAPVFAPLL